MRRLVLFLSLVLLPLSGWGKELKVLTLNVWGVKWGASKLRSERIPLIRDYLAAQAADPQGWDVILLQEVWSAGDQALLAQAGYAFSSTAHVKTVRPGLMVLSRFPILEAGFEPYRTRVPLGWEFAFLSKRGLLWSKIAVPGMSRPLWVGNTHLTANYGKQGMRTFEETRTKQLSEAALLVGDALKHGPVLFGGDLNTAPQDTLWKRMSEIGFEGFSCAMFPPHSCTFGPPNSFVPAEKAEGHLDHLFVSVRDFEPADGQVVLTETAQIKGRSVNLSDHFGWSARFKTRVPHRCLEALE